MSIALGSNLARAARPGRRVALVCLVVAGVSAAASLAVGSPLTRVWQPGGDTDWLLPFIGGALPLLAMLVSAAGLFGGRTTAGGAPLVAVEHLVRQLNDTLAGQREQIAVLKRGCESATQDAAAASARVARLADTAIDAQTRLADGLAQFEQSWERKWDAHLTGRASSGDGEPMTGVSSEHLAADIAQRIEAVMPGFADMVRDRLANFPDPSFDIAASRLNATVTTAMETFRGVVEEAARKIASLNEISQALRRDAVALDLAGREIATAGATVVARAGETISGVDAALAGLPAAVTGVTGAAAEMKGCMAEATLTMRADRAALMAAGEHAEQAAGRLVAAGETIDGRRQAIDSAADRIAGAIATVIAKVDAAEADRTRLSDLTNRLREAADVLNDGTAALTRASRESTGATDASLQALRSAASDMITQIQAALAPLPAATAELATQMRSDIAANVAAAVTDRVSVQIDAAIGTLAEAARVTPAVAEGLTNELTTRIVPHLDLALNALTEAELRLAERGNTLDRAGERAADVCAAAARNLTETSETLAERAMAAMAVRQAQHESDAAFIDRVGQALGPLTAAAQAGARSLEEATDALTARTDEALARVPTVVAAAADTLTARTEEALVRIPAAMAAAADTLTTRTDEALVRVPTAMATAADALAARTEAALARVPTVVAAAADTLTTRADEALARVPAVLTEATDRLTARAEAALARMPEAVSTAAASLARQTDAALARVPAAMAAAADSLAARAAQAAEAFPAAAATLTGAAEAAAQTVAEAAAMLCGDSAALEASARDTATAAASLRQDADAVRLADHDGFRALLQEVEATMGRLTGAASHDLSGLTSVRTTLETAAASLSDGIGRLEAAGLRVAAAGADGIASLAEDAGRQAAAMRDLPAIAAGMDATLRDLRCALDNLAGADVVRERLDALGTLCQRFEAAAGALPATIAEHMAAAVPGGLAAAAERLDAVGPQLLTLDRIGQRLETLADRLPSDLAGAVRDAIPATLPEAAARLDAMAEKLPLDLAECLLEAVPASLPESAERLAGTAPALVAVTQRLESLAAVLPPLSETAERLQTLTPRLERLEDIGDRLDVVASRLPAEVAARLPATLTDSAERLESVGARLETLVARLPAKSGQDTAAALAALSGDVGETVRRVEAALTTHDGALSSLLEAMDRVQAATAAAQAARTPRFASAAEADTSLGATLRCLDSVSDGSEQLLHQAEALADAVVNGRAPGVSSLLSERTPALLVGMEAAARRLRSAATALAIASDGPAAMAASA